MLRTHEEFITDTNCINSDIEAMIPRKSVKLELGSTSALRATSNVWDEKDKLRITSALSKHLNDVNLKSASLRRLICNVQNRLQSPTPGVQCIAFPVANV